MDIRQVLRRRRDGALLLDFPLWFRLALGAISVAMAALMIADGSVYALPVIFAIISAVGALYTQEWVFDPNSERVRSRHGLLFLARTREYPASEIEAVVLERFTRTMGVRTEYVRLKLRIKDGTEVVVDVQKLRGSSLVGHAASIGAAVHAPVVEERSGF